MQTDGQMIRPTDVTTLIFSFYNFEKATKIKQILLKALKLKRII